MDPKLGELERGDVLVEDDRILDASGMVVMPGLVNSPQN